MSQVQPSGGTPPTPGRGSGCIHHDNAAMQEEDARSSSIPFSPMHVDENEEYNSNSNFDNDKAVTALTRAQQEPPFGRDERVWAQDPLTNFYYNATVRDLRWEGNEWRFRIHYQGWNNRWDRWMPAHQIAQEHQAEALLAAGLLSPSKADNQKRKEQERDDDNVDDADDAADDDTANNNTENEEAMINSTGNRKRKNDNSDVSHQGNNNNNKPNAQSHKRRTPKSRKRLAYADYCELPLTLQTVLVEEWERLTRPSSRMGEPPARLVHTLPAAVTIQQVLKHFAKKQKQQYKDNEGMAATGPADNQTVSRTESDIDEFCTGIRELFQTSLPKCLLYHQERPQYEALLRDPVIAQKPLVEVYGCEYLLRLYVRLPFLLPHTDETTKRTLPVGPLLSDLLILMQKNRQACFKGDYRRPRRDEWLDCEAKIHDQTESSGAGITTSSNMEEETVMASALS